MSSCCTVWKEKCSKLEAGRKYLRQAVQILNEQVSKIQADNAELKKAYGEEQARAETEKSGKEKEIALRIDLEKEIAALRAEISSLKQNGSPDTDYKKADVKVLQDHLSKSEKEITQLKELLEKEKRRADSEMKNAETQKKSASEAWKQVKSEKWKASEEKKLANVEQKKAEEFRIQLEALKKEAEEVKLKLVSEISKSEELCKKLEAEELNVEKERKRADLKMVEADEQRKLAEANEKNSSKEKCRAENIAKQLEDARRKIKELNKEKNNFISSRNFSQPSAAKHDQADISSFKPEIHSSHLMQNATSTMDKTVEKEINLLKELLNKEKRKGDSVAKSGAEARKNVKAEKAKADKEKRNADTERKKAEEHRAQFDALKKEAAETKTKLLSEITNYEVENQKLKIETSQLSNQLEECKHKIAELQKQVHELQLSRSVTESCSVLPGKDVNSKTKKLKLTQEKLKLAKVQLKYAKQMEKLETFRRSTLQQELGLIKLDAVNISQRLDALDKWLSSGSQFREDLEKVGPPSNLKKLTLKRKLSDLEPFQMCAQSGSRFLNRSSGALTSLDSLRQELQFTDGLLPTCEGYHTEAISGIHSKLKSLQGGCFQKLVKSSAINSSSASFSDSQLVGSQVKDAFVSASDKWVEENYDGLPSSGISGEGAKIQCHENLAKVAENSDRSPQHIDAFGRVSGHGKKFMGMCDTVESFKYLYSEGKKLHMQMEEKLSILQGILNCELDKPPEQSNYVEISGQHDSFAEHERGLKKRKLNHDERIVMKDLSSIEEQAENLRMGNMISEDPTPSKHVSPCDVELVGTLQEHSKRLRSCFGSDLEPIVRLDEVEGDYMKLLDLENSSDEECYRRAMEFPLSPTLPEVEVPSAEMVDRAIGDSLDRDLLDDMEILEPSCSFDVANVDVSSNNTKDRASKLDGERTSIRQLNDSEVVQLSTIPIFHDGSLHSSNISSKSKLESEKASILKYCVVFSYIKDSGNIFRIFTVTRNCLLSCSLEIGGGCIVQKILLFLKSEKNLLPKEKACVLFTSLLLSFSECSGSFASYQDDDFIFHSSSLASQINAVLSDAEARSLFMDLCCMDSLLGLFKDFLLNGQLVVCADASSEASSESNTGVTILLDGVNVRFSNAPASDGQLFGGSAVLALVCAAIDRTELICEASYNLLRSHKYDNNVLLVILHIFAKFSGNKFCSLEEYSLTMIAIKSIVNYLEREIPSVASTCHTSLHEAKVTFYPCAECPFDAISMDKVVSVLSEKLHSYVNCDPCGLDSSVMPSVHSNPASSGILCDFSDVLSLMELLACYMRWEWISGKLIPVLLEILKKPIEDRFIIAVVILLGQLGRLGIAACGYEDKEVDSLRCKLSNFLYEDKAIDAVSIPVQIAAMVSLLQLLPFDVEGVVKNDLEFLEVTGQSVVNRMRKWFSLLSKEQQRLALGVLQSSKDERC